MGMYWETCWGCLVTSIQVASICEAINVHFGNRQTHCKL